MNGQNGTIQIARTFCPIQKMAGHDKNGRTNSRTSCQQNRIAFSPLLPLNFRDKMITSYEVFFPMRNINNLQGSSILCALKHNHA
jgi:hypothetical protein